MCVSVLQLDGEPCAISGSRDKTLRLWNLRTGRTIGEPLRGHSSWVTCVSVLQLEREPYAISGSQDYTLQLWNLRTGRTIGEPLLGHSEQVTCVSVLQLEGEPCAISGSEDKTLRLWNLRIGAELQVIRMGAEIHSIALQTVDGIVHVVVGTSAGLVTLALWGPALRHVPLHGVPSLSVQ
jgi:WD40 repeat protein